MAVPEYGSFLCYESDIVSLSIEPKDAQKIAHRRAAKEITIASYISAADLERGLNAIAGSKVPAQLIYAQRGTVRVKMLPKKGVVVQRGKDWERNTVTLMQTIDEGKPNLVMVVEGVIASGLGAIIPANVAFTRNMDSEHPAELYEFSQRLITSLAKR